MPPNRLEWNIRRAVRARMTTLTMPATAGATRQPTGPLPQIQDVNPISHLPSGGCTMNMYPRLSS